jgi:hypothetical protein
MIQPSNFLNNLFSLYDETFENHHGIYLDNNQMLGELKGGNLYMNMKWNAKTGDV